MSQYTHRITLVVPELLMPQANQLALIAGESLADVNTFTQANYQDADGNLYAVCSAVIKPIVLSLADAPLADTPLKTKGADLVLAQQAMDKVVKYQKGVTVTPDNIYIGIDIDPFKFFESIGLISVVIDDVGAPI
ncbi:hypothetical protein EI164_00835 [Psychrobacter sp. FME13]|uniref:hypothetical protein n=1 Tax=Psychrobacter sp. FME13 TaxID=2487708 RepID=UPI001787A1B9|nr:hypothetical protein [Psychrobacter sp. FME13]MBE0440624.1 hypothetical protein [Psychrobacter sp. FME13]